tara:strand:+ start:285 stop:653 length:369 start_codon:yes stop_codon:yes gene_type:complete
MNEIISKEFFEYYKSKCKVICYNSKQKEVEKLKNYIKEYEKQLIKNIISTPLIIHKAYECKNGQFHFEWLDNNNKPEIKVFNSLEELLEEIFYVDIRQNAEFVERFIKEFFKYKNQEKINKF